ncbi:MULTISPECIES: class I SAM-dependent methyltransferase [unclassified Actinotignum]|uniref:class I SAM-dependent methyltransferase n=2 Tax=Actinotignum TaxID=1653174 RepID=UPI003F47F8C7
MKPALDLTCGARMMWVNKHDERVIYCDIRAETHQLCDGRTLTINPDQKEDFRNLTFPDESFYLVVFDPPHLNHLGHTSWLAKKYGKLAPSWEDDIRAGFEQAFRVLRPGGVLIFKWNETQIPLSRILTLTPEKPLFGHTGTSSKTHWITFLKTPTSKGTQQ